jgi:tetratricopeptide (TPR) repeat protein
VRDRAAALALAMGLALSAPPGSTEPQAGDRPGQTIRIQTPKGTVDMCPVPEADISGTEPEVQEVLQDHRKVLKALLGAPQPDLGELAVAYGKLGTLYQAHNIYRPAESCYRNAERLAPETLRWPYLLGYLGQQTSRLDLAEEALRRALAIDPGDEPTRLRLAQVYIELNQPQDAEPLLNRPFVDPGMVAAVRFAQGQIALARRHYAQAVTLLEAALKAQPLADRIHYPLGLAYRALGDVNRAKGHFTEYGNGTPGFPDPMVEQLDTLMRGGYTQLHRGVQAVQKGEYAVAVEAFTQALKTEPDNANLRVSLARSLYLAGDEEAGRREFEAALERDPNHVLANFLLGLLLLKDGDDQAAQSNFQRVLTLEPEHAGAHHYLGHLSMNQGRYAEAARHYAASVRNSPRDYPALFMQAMALYRAGAPQTRVKDLLEVGVAEHPDKWMFSYALARLLAASPDGQVRNGRRALALAQGLYDRFPGFQNAEALAMAHAELGDYEKALGMEHYAIANATLLGALGQVPAMEQTLERFRQDQPARTPFYEDDPFFRAPPFSPSGPVRDYPARDPY